MLVSLGNKETLKRLEILACLNRTYELVWEAGGLPIMLDLIQDGSIDRQMIASVIMTAGDEGQRILSKFLKEHPNEKVRIAVASVMGYRKPIKTWDLSIHIEEDKGIDFSHLSLGCICNYKGKVSPVAIEDDLSDSEFEVDQLFVNRRDFLASLNRMLSMNDEAYESFFEEPGVYLSVESDLLEQLEVREISEKFQDQHLRLFV